MPGPDAMIEGYLDIVYVEPLHYWKFAVDGFGIDPSTLVAVGP
jgi:hypothetical protein